jgi:transposase
MERMLARCAGMDVHKDSLVICIRIEGVQLPVQTFGATSAEILRAGDWLAEHGVTILAMESTGVYWRPVWNLLEDRLKLMLVNAQHLKRVPGCKTDVKDCRWIAQLLECGLLEPSFVPPSGQRELRDLTRQRTQLVGDRARVVNRVQKVLESANIKIAGLISDLTGASGRKILQALAEGRLGAAEMAELVNQRMEAKKPALRQALVGRMKDHHRFLLRQLLEQMQHLDGQIDTYGQRIEQVMSPLERDLVKKLDLVPGLDQRTAECVLAEIGTNMGQFPSAEHLASWAGLCPGNNQSGGKRRNSHIRRANRWLKTALTQAAWGASRTRRSYFSEQFRRLSKRRGRKRALIAVAHSLLGVSYELIKAPEKAYADLGADYLDRLQDVDGQIDRLVRHLKRLGCDVAIQRQAA